MTALRGAGLVVALAGCALRGVAQEASARATVDSSEYFIGDAIHVHVALTHPKGATPRAVLGDTLGGFTVLERLPVTEESDTSGTSEIVVSRYEAGSIVLPAIPYQYSFPGDSAARIVTTNPLALTIRAVAVDTTKDIRDLKPPLSIPISLLEILIYLGIAAAAIGAVYIGYRLWKRRGTKAAGGEVSAPPRPAHVIALEELAILKEKKLWQQGLIKQYYSEVTEILRRYIENRYQLKALEETTDEILKGLAGTGMSGDVLRALEKSLRKADLVKFAKAQPGIPEHEEIMAIAYDAVERTKVVPKPQTAEVTAGAGGAV